MNTQIKQTKRSTYIKFGGSIYSTNNDWANKEIIEVPQAIIAERGVDNQYGWLEIGDHVDLQAAYAAFIGLKIVRKREREELKAKLEAEQSAKWDAIKDLNIIPATLDNIRTVLVHLNSSNWGGWHLPKLSIGYTAAQYDCDGVQASTIKLDSAVEVSKLFKVGGKAGHLNKYTRI